MTKKNELETLVNSYFDTRKTIYTHLQEGNKVLAKELNSKKHNLVNEMFDLLTEHEHAVISKSFAEIVSNKIAKCSTKDMENYMKTSGTDEYFQCLELQKTALLKVVNQNIRSTVTIADLEDKIMVCPGGYHDGECLA